MIIDALLYSIASRGIDMANRPSVCQSACIDVEVAYRGYRLENLKNKFIAG